MVCPVGQEHALLGDFLEHLDAELNRQGERVRLSTGLELRMVENE